MSNIYVIGSLGRDEKIKDVAKYYRSLGNNVEYVKKQPQLSCRKLVEECFNKIEKADEVIVIPKCDGTIGIGVTYEIAFANRVGTKVTILNEQENEEKERCENMDIDLSYLAETTKKDKIIVDNLSFVVKVTDPKRPYYSILYHPINSEEEIMGFGSYNQNFVKQWKDEYFIVKTSGEINE